MASNPNKSTIIYTTLMVQGLPNLCKGKIMNKVLLQFGLLIFCFSLIFFSQRGMPLQDVVMKSFIVFISLTIVLSVVVLFVFKMINKKETLTPVDSKKSE